MRVPDTIKRCVVFLGEIEFLKENFGSLAPRGTAFLIAQPSEFGDGDVAAFYYLVTAKHVIDGMKGKITGARINRREGGAEMIGLGDKWWFHPTDRDVDVAVIPFAMSAEDVRQFDLVAFPTRGFATDEAIADADIGVGDEVFMTGLFAHMLGSGQNRPIVRMGNISLLAGEPFRAGKRLMQAHLIEARSIGGLSGSPAFVRQTVSIGFSERISFESDQVYKRLRSGELPSDALYLTGIGPFYLLGLMHGHWDLSVKQKNEVMFVEDQVGKVNMGIALVVPATKILETINQPELTEMRRAIHEVASTPPLEPVLDNLGAGTTDEEAREQLTPQGFKVPVPIRSQFVGDLTKATRKLK